LLLHECAQTTATAAAQICHKSLEENIYMRQTDKRVLADTVIDAKTIVNLFNSGDTKITLRDRYGNDMPEDLVEDLLSGAAMSSTTAAAAAAASTATVTGGHKPAAAIPGEQTLLGDMLRRRGGRLQTVGAGADVSADVVGDAPVEDAILAVLLDQHTVWIGSHHENKNLLEHDPSEMLSDEVSCCLRTLLILAFVLPKYC
jgi:hypothetical protein